MNRLLEWEDLGLMPCREAFALQEGLRGRRVRGEIGDRLLFVEHPPVFTTGWRDCAGDFLSTPAAIAADGIEIVPTNRGGRVTYHGPGQLVAYFICELSGFGLGIKAFVHAIEEACIGLLKALGIEAARDPAHPGLWVGRDKIVAIGMNVAHGVTQHGLAINVACDLAPYRHIVACGVRGRGATSMAAHLGRRTEMASVRAALAAEVGRSLGCRLVPRQATVKVSSSAWGVSSSGGGSS